METLIKMDVPFFLETPILTLPAVAGDRAQPQYLATVCLSFSTFSMENGHIFLHLAYIYDTRLPL